LKFHVFLPLNVPDCLRAFVFPVIGPTFDIYFCIEVICLQKCTTIELIGYKYTYKLQFIEKILYLNDLHYIFKPSRMVSRFAPFQMSSSVFVHVSKFNVVIVIQSFWSHKVTLNPRQRYLGTPPRSRHSRESPVSPHHSGLGVSAYH
jgi:hypothetical protein